MDTNILKVVIDTHSCFNSHEKQKDEQFFEVPDNTQILVHSAPGLTLVIPGDGKLDDYDVDSFTIENRKKETEMVTIKPTLTCTSTMFCPNLSLFTTKDKKDETVYTLKFPNGTMISYDIDEDTTLKNIITEITDIVIPHFIVEGLLAPNPQLFVKVYGCGNVNTQYTTSQDEYNFIQKQDRTKFSHFDRAAIDENMKNLFLLNKKDEVVYDAKQNKYRQKIYYKNLELYKKLSSDNNTTINADFNIGNGISRIDENFNIDNNKSKKMIDFYDLSKLQIIHTNNKSAQRDINRQLTEMENELNELIAQEKEKKNEKATTAGGRRTRNRRIYRRKRTRRRRRTKR